MFTHLRALRVEWGDCDPAGIVFYPRYFAMFDAATAFLLEAASGMTRAALIRHYCVVGWPMVDTRAIFSATASFDDQILIESRVTRLGRSSFDIEHRLLRGNTVCVEATEVRVWATRSGEQGPIKASPLPDELREVLARS